MDSVNIVIGADLVPVESNFDLFRQGDVKTLLGEKLIKELEAADYRVFNLELALCGDDTKPIDKYGPGLRAPEETINGIKNMNPSLFTIGNNHIMDFGKEGLNSTTRLLDKNDIAYIGAGKNLDEAKKPYIFEKNGKKIGVYACAEHEFSIAEEDKAGANPYDALESFDHVTALKAKCDYVIVLYHGGKEYYRYPSPNLQRICRKFADKGADIVLCQHSHCIGCKEDYNSSVIVYGQGNFLFDRGNTEFWQTSLLVKAEFGEKMCVSYIPLKKEGNTVRLAEGKDGEDILNDFYERSEQIRDKEFIKKAYSEISAKFMDDYFYIMAGGASRFKKDEVFSHPYSKQVLMGMRNYLECEAHNELFITALRNEADKAL